LAASINALAEIIGTATNRLRQQIELDGDGEAGKTVKPESDLPLRRERLLEFILPNDGYPHPTRRLPSPHSTP